MTHLLEVAEVFHLHLAYSLCPLGSAEAEPQIGEVSEQVN